LEEHKANFKKNYSKNHKELEVAYEDIDLQTVEEKKMRVKINQLENDLEH
jgi:heme oxygenase